MRSEKVWEEKLRRQFIAATFTPRLQRDLNTISLPKDMPSSIESTYIFGETNTGKTVLAAFMLLEEQKRCYLNSLLKNEKYDHCIFTNTSDLIFEIRNIIEHRNNNDDDDDSNEESKTEQRLIDYYSNVHLLVLDDFGTVKPSDWVLQILYLIINRRYEFLKKTIFTSNLSLEELTHNLKDSRIPARIYRMARIIHKTPYDEI